MKQPQSFNTIYIWRIIFTLMILIFHFDNAFSLWSFFELSGKFGWYIAVEFFFIVSGFLIYQKAEADKRKTLPHIYLWGRIKKIWPPYIIAYLLTFITIAICRNDVNGPASIYEYFIDNFPEALMLHGIGLGRGWDYINPIAWYIPILLISSFLIYYLLFYHKQIFENIIAPIIIAICFSWIYRTHGNLDVTISSMSGFYENGALMRGLSEMCLGVYAAKLNSYIENQITNGVLQSRNHKITVLKVSAVITFLYVIIASVQYGYSHADFTYVVCLFYAITIGFLPCTKCFIGPSGEYTRTAKILIYFSNISLYQYLLHQMYRDWIFPILFPNRQEFALSFRICLLLIYLLVVTLTAILLDWIIKKCSKQMHHKMHKI